MCAGCRLATYCGAVCQRAAWKAHKPACLAARERASKAAAPFGKITDAFAAMTSLMSGQGSPEAMKYLQSFGGFVKGARLKIDNNTRLNAAPLPAELVGTECVIVDDTVGADGKIVVKCFDGVERRMFTRYLWPML